MRFITINQFWLVKSGNRLNNLLVTQFCSFYRAGLWLLGWPSYPVDNTTVLWLAEWDIVVLTDHSLRSGHKSFTVDHMITYLCGRHWHEGSCTTLAELKWAVGIFHYPNILIPIQGPHQWWWSTYKGSTFVHVTMFILQVCASVSVTSAALSLVHIADNGALRHPISSVWRSRTCRFVLSSPFFIFIV